MTIQSYRHRYGYAPGDPALEPIEHAACRAAQDRACRRSRCRARPTAFSRRPPSSKHAVNFTGPYQRRVLPNVGHNPPQEAPEAFAEAVLELIGTGGYALPLTNAANAALL